MSCGCEKGTGCVIDILKEIANAQKDIYTECCATSAEQSINDLLGNWGGSTGFDTVPFILYNQDGTPFRGLGVVPGSVPGALGPLVASFYFRVKTVYEDGCAVLELLRDPADLNLTPDTIDVQAVANLTATGVCFTVDLHCFCHISTLPAISAFNGNTGTTPSI